jgi:eukaryotic-like serine/threonine-protein kinase
MNRESVVRLDSIGAEVRIDVHLDVSDPRTGRAEWPPSSPSPSAPEGLLQPGRIIGGRYELVRVLGRGSMGAVWMANHTTLGERVALKLMATTADGGAAEDASTSVARFRFEAQVAARLSRKTRHVVRVTDHGHDGSMPYLVMELLEGQTLERALLCRGPLSLAEVCALVTQIARGLEAAHSEGILHRDLKPANVFLADTGEGRPLVKLLDFGVARAHRAQRLAAPFATARGLIVGTPGYMSPEQATASEIDFRCDLWSLAAIAYEALTSELPVVGIDAEQMLSNLRARRTVPLSQHRPDLPSGVGCFFERAFAPRIEDRHATCAELAHAFEQAARSGATPEVTTRLPAAASPGDKPRRRSALLRLAVGACVAGAGLAGLTYAMARWSPQSRGAPETLSTGPARERSDAVRSSAPELGRSPQGPGDPGSELAGGAFTVVESSRAASHSVVAPPTPASPKAARSPQSGDLGEFKSYY